VGNLNIPPFAIEFLKDPAMMRALENEAVQPEDEGIANLMELSRVDAAAYLPPGTQDWELVFFWASKIQLNPIDVDAMASAKILVGIEQFDEPYGLYWNDGPEVVVDLDDIDSLENTKIMFVLYEGEQIDFRSGLIIAPTFERKNRDAERSNKESEERPVVQAKGIQDDGLRDDLDPRAMEICPETQSSPGHLFD
jgi:hypothetical protein